MGDRALTEAMRNVDTILRLMARDADDAVVVEHGLALLRTAAGYQGSIDVVLSRVGAIVAAMTRFVALRNADVVYTALQCLHKVTAPMDNCPRVVSHAGAVVAAVRAFPYSPSHVQEGVAVLSGLALTQQGVATKLIAYVDTVVALMKRHPALAALAQNGLVFVSSFAYWLPYLPRLAPHLQFVVDTVLRHPSDTGVLFAGLNFCCQLPFLPEGLELLVATNAARVLRLATQHVSADGWVMPRREDGIMLLESLDLIRTMQP